MNKQIILGRIGQIEKKNFEWGSVLKFSVATSEKYKKKDGEKVEETTWHNCEAFGTLADVIEKFFKKGDGIYVEGKTKHEKYEKDGVEKYSTKVKIDTFSFLPTKKSEGDTPPTHPTSAVQPHPLDLPSTDQADDMPF